MSTSKAQERGKWHVARKMAAGSVVAGVMVVAAAGTAFAAPGGHDGASRHGRHGDHPGQQAGHRRAVEGVVSKLGTSGGFTMTRGIASITVDVTATTAVVERGQSSPQVAVGDRVVVFGTETTPGTFTASRVAIKVPEKSSVRGTVQSIATGGGSFTLVRGVATVTVDVTSTTTYATTGGAAATFADMKVGDHVEARGVRSGTAFEATLVSISVPAQRAILGTVVTTGSTSTGSTNTGATNTGSTNTGSTNTGSTNTTANSFTMTNGDAEKPVTVDVSATTVYLEEGSTTATFSSIAAGDEVVVVGTHGDGVVDASTVVVLSTAAPTAGTAATASS